MRSLAVALVVLFAPFVHAHVCPDLALECVAPLESIDSADLLAESAEPYEVDAYRAIRSGSIGKAPLDFLRRQGGVDMGAWHLYYGQGHRDVLGIGLDTGRRDWRDWALAALYSDVAVHGLRIQLAEWRRRLRSTVETAREAGCHGGCLVVVASIGNSSPGLARSLGRRHRWRVERMLREYATSGHRRRRARFLVEWVL